MLVDGSPASASAVRRAAALAPRIHAGLVALVPPQESTEALGFDAARDLREAIDLAKDLGAAVLRLGIGELDAELAIATRAACATHLFLPSSRRGWSPGSRGRRSQIGLGDGCLTSTSTS